MSDSIEFFKDGEQAPFLIVDSAFQPNDGDLVSIRGETWKVIGRSFSVDYADTARRRMRCNVIVRAAAAIGSSGEREGDLPKINQARDEALKECK